MAGHTAAAVRQEGHPADTLCGLVSGAVSAPQPAGDGGVADVVPRLGALKNVPDLTALLGAGGAHPQRAVLHHGDGGNPKA